ncbi:hypothetical protein F5146DRAFT_1003333 [Armillaria mellea]|nr:hypothetical protein F5146DRAFT_1003333 [Armillaria mellea]
MDLNFSDLSNVCLPATKTPSLQFACMSSSEGREVHIDSTESLRAFIAPPIGINLKDGLHIYLRRVGSDPTHNHPNRLDRILRILLLRDAQQLNVFLYDGVLYIEVYDPAPDRVHTFVHDGECIGSNFEALCTGELPKAIHDLHTRWADKLDRLELKTRSQKAKQPPAKLRWYFQSSLIGVLTIVLGCHKRGVLTAVDMIDVASMVNETTLQQRYDNIAIVLSALRRHSSAIISRSVPKRLACDISRPDNTTAHEILMKNDHGFDDDLEYRKQDIFSKTTTVLVNPPSLLKVDSTA